MPAMVSSGNNSSAFGGSETFSRLKAYVSGCGLGEAMVAEVRRGPRELGAVFAAEPGRVLSVRFRACTVLSIFEGVHFPSEFNLQDK